MLDNERDALAAPEHRRTASQHAQADPAARITSDIARQVDVDLLRREVGDVADRVGDLRDELSAFVIQHAQEHTATAGDWEKRWSLMTAELAYRKGLIGLPRLVLEFLRQYLPTIVALLAGAAAIAGLATGSVTVGVGQ